MVLSACTSVSPSPAPASKSDYVYRVGPGDVLAVEVFDEANLQRQTTITPDGHITFPLVGDVKVIDKTLPEVEALMVERLLEYLAKPAVTVTLQQSGSARVHVFGEVGRQGPQPFHDRMSLASVLSAAGINWTTAKLGDVRVVRGSLDDPILYEVAFDDVLAAAEPDLFLAPGDMVIVPPKWVTRMDRYTGQVLSPIRNLMSTGQQAAGRVATGGL